MALKIKDFEGEYAEVIQRIEEDRDLILVEEDGFQQIWREQGCIYILGLGIDVYAATSCTYDEDTQDYEINSSLYLFYDHDTDTQIYAEIGSSLSVCIYNFARLTGRNDIQDVDTVEDLSCVYDLHWNKH